MSEWKVSPTEGVTNNNNGTFSFDANAPHKTYVISYTDDEGCKATYTYKLKTDCGGGGGDCSCSVTSVYNNTNIFSKDGSDSLKTVAEISNFSSECTCSDISSISIYPDTSSCSENECSSFQILYDITATTESGKCVVKAKVKANNGGSGHNVIDGVEKWHYKVGSCGDYFNFYQYAGSEPPPSTCSPTHNSTLDGYVTKFNTALGTTIGYEQDKTPCTYEYLLSAYSAVSSKGDKAIMWMLANVLSELTPNVGKTTSYFEVASSSEYGGVEDLIDSENTYNDRINGGVEYARWRGNSFQNKNTMAENARAELIGKGINEAKLITAPTNPDGTFNFPRGSVIHPANIVPNMGGQTNISDITISDINKMYDILSKYPDTNTIINGDETHGIRALGTDPFADKEYCSERLLQIMGAPYNDSDWIDFIYNVKDATDAAVNDVKYSEHRLRPTKQNINGLTADGVCDTSGAEQAARNLCSDTDTCETENNDYYNRTNSYPSGHSGRGYIAGLAYLEVTGIDKTSRMSDYCYHRAIVRAHWVSDTIAAKLIASTVIGFLNGVRQYLSQVNELKN